MFGVQLARFRRMMMGVQLMSMGQMRVMRARHVIFVVVMFGGLAMMIGGALVMLRGLTVMLGDMRLAHD